MTNDDRRLKQAARCLKLAERVTDPVLAERLRTLAAEFMERRDDDVALPAKAH
jgi:hypothetical protein